MHVAGRHGYLHPFVLVVPILAADLTQHLDDLARRPVAGSHEREVPFRQVRRHLSREVGFSAIKAGNHRILVHHRGSVGDAHARGLVGVDDLICDFHAHRAITAPGRVNCLDCGRARLNHLHGAIELVQVGINGADTDAVEAPHLQGQVRRSHLEGREAHVEMIVDQTGHDNVVAGADYLGVGMLLAQDIIGADCLDHAVPLEHRAVGDHLGRIGARNLADDVLSPYQR